MDHVQVHEIDVRGVRRDIYVTGYQLNGGEIARLVNLLKLTTPHRAPGNRFGHDCRAFEFRYNQETGPDGHRTFLVQGISHAEASRLLEIWCNTVCDDYASVWCADMERPGELVEVAHWQPWRNAPPPDPEKQERDRDAALFGQTRF